MAAEAQSLSGSEILEYWTPERMKEAKPEVNLKFSSAAPTKTKTEVAAPTAAGPIKIVSDSDLTKFPYQSVGKLFYAKGSNNYAGSAYVVNVTDKNVIFTAAHCLDSPEGKATNIVFVPAMININDTNGQLYGRYPQISGGQGVAWAVDNNWDPGNMQERYDMGSVKLLPRSSDGKNVGEVVTPITLEADLAPYNPSTSWNTIGYPGVSSQDPQGKMAEREGTYKNLDNNVVYKYGGMLQGMSGGPWMLADKANGNQSNTDEVDDLAKSPYYTVASHSALFRALGCN